MAPSLLCTIIVLALSSAPQAPAGPPPVASKQEKPLGFRSDNGCTVVPSPGGRTMTCLGHVKLWRDDLSLTCEKLTGDFGKDGALKTAHCFGAVKIVSLQGTAVASDARFDNTTNQAVLTGKPRLQQSGSVVEGQTIRFDVKTGAVSVEGGVSGVISGAALPSGGTP